MKSKKILFYTLLLLNNIFWGIAIGVSFLSQAANFDLPENKYADKPIFYQVDVNMGQYLYVFGASVIFAVITYILFDLFKNSLGKVKFVKVFFLQFVLFVLIFIVIKLYLKVAYA